MASARLKQILDIITTNSEESIEDFLIMSDPDSHSREELQETFEEVLGYDPITHYDRQGMSEIADEIAGDVETSEEVSEYIKESKDELLDEALENFEADKPDYYKKAVEDVLSDKFDYPSNEDDDDEGYDD